jgi:hypothetical protein
MRNRKQAFRSSLAKAEEPLLVCLMALVGNSHEQWIKENVACFRE